MAEHGSLFDEEEHAQASRVAFPSNRLRIRDSLTVRIMIALGCIALTTVIVYAGRDGYRDSGTGEELGILDALYYATVSLSTTGYGDITPVSDSTRLTNTLVITPLRFMFLIVLVGTTIEVLTQAARQRSRVNRWRSKVKDHIVIVGFGVKGQAAMDTLLGHGAEPASIVVIAEDRYAVAEATRKGLTGVVGDARSVQVLKDAGVPSASKVIVAADQDDTSIMVTLRVRKLAPTATIVAAARESSAAELLRQSGADRVITHAESAGNLMGQSLISGNVGEMLEDLMDTRRGLEFVERKVERAELGLTPSDIQAGGELVLGIVRDGEVHRFDEGKVKVFQLGDRIVVIRPSGRSTATRSDIGSPAVPRGTDSSRGTGGATRSPWTR